MIEVGSSPEFVFEVVSTATGAQVTAPTGMALYAVRPGQTEAEVVPGAEFQAVSAATFKTSVPSEFTKAQGLLVVFALADNASSKQVGVFQVGQPLAVNEPAWVPFAARGFKGEARLGLLPADVTLSVDLGSPLSRSVLTSEFVQLFGPVASPTPFYLVSVRAEELSAIGVLTYSVEGSGLRSYSESLTVGAENLRKFRIRLEPVLPGVTVEVLHDNAGRLLSLVSNSVGEVGVTLPDGEYTVRLSKSGLTFSENNVALVVDETADYYVLSSQNTEDAPQPAGFCRITFRLLNPDGTPLQGRKLLFMPTLALTGAGAGVVKQAMAVTTNSDGRGEIMLIPGLEITVNVEGTRINESFVVPSAATADLFGDNLISFEDKGFDYYMADFEYGIKRTLNP